ncbi:Bile acid:sodium symporter/arsenical resistance protein Acr3, partial [Trinorchestia longiramus]
MAGQFVLLPACGSFLSWVFKFTPYEAMGVLMVTCSPGGSFSNFFTYWVDGDLALSIVMTTCSSTLAFIGMPLNLWLYSKLWISADEAAPLIIPYVSIITALVFVTVPVGFGMLIRHYNARIAGIVTKIASTIGWLGASSVMVIWGLLYWPVFASATPLLYVSSFLLPVMGIFSAYGFARLTGRTHKICRTIGIETGSQNMVVALSIILLSFKEPEVKSSMLIFPTLYGCTLVMEMFMGIGAYQAWKKCSKKSDDDYLPVTQTVTIIKTATAK